MVSGSRCVSFVSHRVSRFVFRLPSPGGLCLLQLPIVFFHLSLPQLSSTCHPVVSQLSSRCGFLDVVSELPPRFLHLLSSCFPLVSRMWSPNGLLIAFHTSHLSPRIGFPIVSKCLPFVTPLFPSCLSDVDSCLSPSCLAFVLQMWSSNCLPVCSRCDLAVVFHLTPTTLSCLPDLVPQSFSQLFSSCFRVASQMWSSSCLPSVSLSLEFESANADGLQSWVNCFQLSGCLSLLVCISLCLPLWLQVSDSPDFSC